MRAGRAGHAETRDGLADDARAFLLGELRERFVLEPRDRVAFVVVANPALESRETATTRIGEPGAQRIGIERGLTETEQRAHPPATGGMNTTASPLFSGCVQSPNSALTATRSMSGGSVKGYFVRSSAYRSRGVRARVVSVSALRPACSRSSAKYCTRNSSVGFPSGSPFSEDMAWPYSSAVFTLSRARGFGCSIR